MKISHGDYLGRAELEALGVICGGDHVQVHRSCVIVHPEGLQLGNFVRVDAFCVLSAGGGIELSDNVHIGTHCSLLGAGGIALGQFSGLSHGSRLFSASDDFSGRHAAGPMVPAEFRKLHTARIELQRYTGVGANSTILPGVTMHEGSVLGAQSLLRKDLPEWTIWFGSPAKQIRRRRKDVRDLEPLVLQALARDNPLG